MGLWNQQFRALTSTNPFYAVLLPKRKLAFAKKEIILCQKGNRSLT